MASSVIMTTHFLHSGHMAFQESVLSFRSMGTVVCVLILSAYPSLQRITARVS